MPPGRKEECPLLALKIIGGVLLALILLLSFSVRVRFSLLGGDMRLTVHYLFFRLTLIPERAKKEKKPKKKAAKKEKPEKEKPPEQPKEKPKTSLKDMIARYRPLLRTVKNSLRKFCKHIVIYKVEAGIDVAREDAHQTAVAYAKTASLILALTELLDSLFTFRKKYLRVSPAFTQDKTTVNLSLRVRLRPIFALAAGLRVLTAFLKAAPGKTQKSKSNRKGGQHYESAKSNR